MLLSEAYKLFTGEYIALRGLTTSTEENYSLAVVSFTRAVGDKPVTEIVPSDFLTWRRWMEKRNKPGTVRCHMSKLKNILIFTNKRGLTSFNISEIYLPKLPPPLPEFVTKEEIDKMIDTTPVLRNKLMLSMMFSSGIRAGELCRLDKSDISGNQVFVRQGKCNSSRMVFIDQRTVDLLEQYYRTREDSEPCVFYSYKRCRLTTGGVNHLVKGIAKEAGLKKKVHSHMIRHGFGTHMTKSGIDVTFTQRMMGHAFVNTTMLYVHLTNSDLQGAHAKVFH